MRAAIDPDANAVHVELQRGRRPKSPDARARKQEPARKNAQRRPRKLDAVGPSLFAARRGKHAGSIQWRVANE